MKKKVGIDSSINTSPARTGGEWFLKILQALPIKYLFGTTGGGMPDIQDAMTEVRPPIWIQSLHEFPSVAAAMGYALAAEEPAVCLIDRVVGTANALGAFYAAHENYAPLVIFASQNLPAWGSGKQHDGNPREYGTHYHSWQSILPTPWTKWRYELAKLSLLPGSVLKAISLATAEPKGPVYMTLRQDLMAERVSASPIPSALSHKSKTTPDQDSIALAAQLLSKAKNPIIWAANMGRNSAAVPQLIALAEVLGCGVLDGRNFFNFPMEHPLFLGFYKSMQKNKFIEEADLLLNIEGCYEPPLTPPATCKVIDILPDLAVLQGGNGGDYGGTYYPADCRLIGDAAATLEKLISTLRNQGGLTASIVAERFRQTQGSHDRLLAEWSRERQQHLEDSPISPHRIAFELNKLWDEKTIWVDCTHSGRQALMQGISMNRAGTYFSNPSGHLGAMAGAAYGIALARPQEKVIATMGDGDFIFSNPAAVLWTCSHYHIPVLFLVFNNQCWGIEWPFIRDATLGLAASKQNYEHVDLSEPAISFTKLAESMNIQTETIAHAEEAARKLQWGIDKITEGEPVLIEIQLGKYTKGASSYQYVFTREQGSDS